ncbi:MAG: acyl-CoA dehydrogenase family protein [Acidimicrobiales bacterium]
MDPPGDEHFVVDGASAQELIVAARLQGTEGDGGIGLFVVAQADVRSTPLRALDPTQQHATVELSGVRVPADLVLGIPGQCGSALCRGLEEATTAVSIMTVGTCQSIFDMTLAYAKVREQFGVPIGSFQAVKHKLADMFVALERARAVAYFAALTIEEDDPRRALATAMAKAAAGECQRLLVQDGLQLHGGIGYTWEHDLHLFLKRAKSGDAQFGTAAVHRARVARLIGLDTPDRSVQDTDPDPS